MAGEPTTEGSGDTNYKVHAKDYGLLISLLKWGAIISIALGFLVMIIISD